MYKLLRLMLGLGPALRIFTELVKIPISILRRFKIRLIVYMDDVLLMGAPRRKSSTNARFCDKKH